MSTLSVCLIVKNEEDCIEKCINSLQSFSDEICIYDTGSTDNTVEICKKLNKVKIVQGEWRKDFAWARNQSFSMATCDYIMWVDADDIIDSKSQTFLKNYKEDKLSEFDMVYMLYRYNVNPLNDSDILHFYRGRILKRILYPTWIGRIHETVGISSKQNLNVDYVSEKSAYVCHYKTKNQGTRNLDIFREMDTNNEIYRGRDWFYYGNELRDNNFIDEAINSYKKAIKSKDVWNIDKLNSYINIARLYINKNDYSNALYAAYSAACCTIRPRADVCSIIGDIYQHNKVWDIAKVWYELALNNFASKLDATFFDETFATWRPLLNLCVCEFNLGNIEKAEEYNNRAAEIVPDNKDVIQNRKTFNTLHEKQNND